MCRTFIDYDNSTFLGNVKHVDLIFLQIVVSQYAYAFFSVILISHFLFSVSPPYMLFFYSFFDFSDYFNTSSLAVMVHACEGRVQDFQIEGEQHAALIQRAKREVPYTAGVHGPLKGSGCSCILSEPCFEAL